MMKVLAICSSDVLGITALLQLKQQNALACIAVPDKIAPKIVPALKNLGIQEQEISVLTKKNLEADLDSLIRKNSVDAIFVFTFPWLIPSGILNLLPGRCINFHPGLLPKYKGADPIFWQIKNGENTGGIGIHIMTDEIDAGPLLYNAELPIVRGETYGLYAQRLGMFIAQQVNRVLELLKEPRDYNDTSINALAALYFKKPTDLDLFINWQVQTADEIENLVNATNPRYGGALTTFRNMGMRVLEVAPITVNNPSEVAPGTIVYADGVHGLIVACINMQYLKLSVVQIQEGIISGAKLFNLGVAVGERLG